MIKQPVIQQQSKQEGGGKQASKSVSQSVSQSGQVSELVNNYNNNNNNNTITTTPSPIDHRTSNIEHRSSIIDHRSSIIDHRLVVGGWRWFVDQSYQNCTVQCTSLHFINFTSSLSLTVVHSSLTHSAHSLSVTVSEASVAQHSFYCL